MSAYLIRSNGTVKDITPAKGSKFTLDQLQRYVGGYIEYVPLQKKHELITNEEGALVDLPTNRVATMLVMTKGYGTLLPEGGIHGDVVYTFPSNSKSLVLPTE